MVYVAYTGSFTFSISILLFPARPDPRAHTCICAAGYTYTPTHKTLKEILYVCRTRGTLAQDNRLYYAPLFSFILFFPPLFPVTLLIKSMSSTFTIIMGCWKTLGFAERCAPSFRIVQLPWTSS